MKITKEELLEKAKSIIGETTDDAALSLLEDISDSMEETPSVDWKKKYEENDAAWRQKYKDRFFSSGADDDDDEYDKPDDKQKTRFEDLFT